MAEALFWSVLGHLKKISPDFGVSGWRYCGIPRRFKRVINVVDTTTIQLMANCLEWGDGQTTETVEFAYDGDGNRVSKTSDSTTTQFVLDGQEIAEEVTGATITSYVGPGLIEKIVGQNTEIYHADGMGSTRAITDDDQGQTVLQVVLYDAYGNVVATYGGSGAPSFGYAGQFRYFRDDTGLMHLKARYYGASTGRFISRDPIGYSGGLNLYGYVGDNPTNLLDPSGMLKVLPWIPRIGGRILPVLGLILLRKEFCWDPAFDAGEKWRKEQNHEMAHCVAACLINRCFGGSYPEATIVGGLLEWWQWFFPEKWSGTGGWFDNPFFDWAIFYNTLGAGIGSGCEPCEDACADAVRIHSDTRLWPQ